MKTKVKADVVWDITINYDGANVTNFTCHGVRIVEKEGTNKNRTLFKKRIQKNLAVVR